MTEWASAHYPTLCFSPKRPSEKITLGMDFVNLLGSGESISSTQWSIISVRPLNVSTAGMLTGSATISGTKVFQQVQAGTNNTIYEITAQITTSLTNILEENAMLECTSSPYK